MVKLILALAILFGFPAYAAYSPSVSITSALSVSNTFTSSTGIINEEMLTSTVSGWYDAGSYAWVSLDIFTTTTVTGGVVTFEQTNDITNDAAGTLWNLQDSTVITQTNVTSLTLAASTIKHYQAPITHRFIRLRISTAFAGTGNLGVTAQFRQTPYAPLSIPIVQATASSLNATATIGSGTVTTVTTLANGQTASGSAATGSPLRVGATVLTTLPTTLATGQAVNVNATTAGQFVTKEFGTAENDWQATSGATALTTTATTALKAAGAASIRNYVTGCQLLNASGTVSTAVYIEDGSTIIWSGYLPLFTSTSPLVAVNLEFHTPLRGTAATAMNIVLSASGASVLYNCQGYQSF